MAITPNPQGATGVWNAVKGALGVFDDINKTSGVDETTNQAPADLYESTREDKEIIELTDLWKRAYNTYYKPIEDGQKVSFEYWVGKQKTSDPDVLIYGDTPPTDNLIFESIETFLPIAGRANPDPVVQSDPTPTGEQLANSIKQLLVFEADRQKLRMKLKRMTRHWILFRIGIGKVVWDTVEHKIDTLVIHPKRIIFDKDGYIDESGFFVGQYIGEKKTTNAEKLIELFPKKKAEIEKKAKGKLGTKLDYTEWWYQNKELFFTLEEVVLGKFKNPHWNYDGEDVVGKNHFRQPKAPYVFLNVFSTGMQPHDDTSLVLQNIPIQDLVNRRWVQIDKNVASMNNGIVVNGKAFTAEQASQAATALRKGTAIRVPSPTGGGVLNDVSRFPAPDLPDAIFKNLQDARAELRNIFGTSGATPQGIASEETARGKILVNQLDSSRIGGGVTEYIEQVADSLYNTWIQFLYVHNTEGQLIVVLGQAGAEEALKIKNTDFAAVESLTVTVKEGSLIPKDPLTQRNEAIDLWSANAIDPKSLYKKLDYPDPEESAKQLLLWQMVQKGILPPTSYIPDFQAPQTQLPQQGVGGPPVNPIGPATPPSTPPEGTQGAEEIQGKQLLQSVPIK